MRLHSRARRGGSGSGGGGGGGLWRLLPHPSYRCLRFILFCQVFTFVLGWVFFMGGGGLKDLWMYATYMTRPLWDSHTTSFTPIPHFHADGVEQITLCGLHTWDYLPQGHKVIDAVIFANELDLLEIRLKELYPVVDMFLIVESERTFTDKPKPTLFHNNRARFAFAEDKIVYGLFKSPPVTAKEAKTMKLETLLRIFVTELLEKHGVVTGDRVIMADVDEIPSRHTIALVKYCDGYPTDMHLGMRNYLYSFEFPLTHQAGYLNGDSPSSFHWRPRVHTWHTGHSLYNHSRETDNLLVDSGWHCSFCFRYLEDFTFKMTAYSHSDRVRYDDLLEEERIQKIICKGSDIFGMPPEAFSFYDLLLTWLDPIRTHSIVHLPAEVVAHPDKYNFMLPGNCIRKPNPS
jgi:beta-1,4-mannosyl-glycoprotein beta-1,4-N-acetylglucosaminyltransferase